MVVQNSLEWCKKWSYATFYTILGYFEPPSELKKKAKKKQYEVNALY